MSRFAGVLVACCASIAGCASGPAPGTFDSHVLVQSFEHEHPPFPLHVVVRDIRGNVYTVGIDEAVRAPTPPDGQLRETTLRELLGDCVVDSNVVPVRFVSPTTASCWLNRPMRIEPQREKDHDNPKGGPGFRFMRTAAPRLDF